MSAVHTYKIIQYKVEYEDNPDPQWGYEAVGDNSTEVAEMLKGHGFMQSCGESGFHFYEASHDVTYVIRDGYCVMIMGDQQGIEIFSEKVMKYLLDEQSFAELLTGQVVEIELEHGESTV